MARKLLLLSSILILSLVSPAWAVNYTEDANCQCALLMDVDEDPLTDSSGEGNTGVLKGAGEPDYDASGKFNGCYHWDGSNDYATISNIDISSAGSVVGYMKMDVIGNDNALIALDKSSSEFQLWADDANIFKIAVYDGGWIVRSGTTTYVAETWYHVGFTHDNAGNGVNKLYVNGVQEGADLAGNIVDDVDNNWLLGKNDFDDAKCTDGFIDDFGAFDRILDSTEINDIMDNGLAGAVPPARRIILIGKR